MEPLSDGKGSIFFARRGRNTGGPGEIQAVRKKYRWSGRNTGGPEEIQAVRKKYRRSGRNTGGPEEIQAARKKCRRSGRNAGVPTKYGRLAQIRQLLLFKEVVGRYPSPTSV